MSYHISKRVLSPSLIVRLLDFVQTEIDTRTVVNETDNSYMYGNNLGQNITWRKHTSFMPSRELMEEVNNTIVDLIPFDTLYGLKKPTLMNDVLINIYETGEFVDMHTDPSTSMWRRDSCQRKANFSCVLFDKFTGGEFQVEDDILPCTKPGDVITFAQPQKHQIHPITTGRRIVVFGWVYDESDLDDN